MAFKIDYSIIAVDKFSKVAERIIKSTKRLNTSIKKINIDAKTLNNRINNLTPSFLKFRNIIAGAALILGFKKLVNIGAAFQDNLLDLKAITGISGNQLQKMTKTSKRLGIEFATSSKKVLTATKLIASARSQLIGVEGGLEKVTRSALTLKVASGIDLAVAVGALTVSMNQFSASADEANRFTNVLAAGAKIGASEVSETASAIKNSGAFARAAGVSFEELNAAIQVLAQGGIKAEEAGTALKTMFIQLAQAQRKFGEEAGQFNPEKVGLITAFENMSEIQIDVSAATQLFGQRAAASGLILRENVKTLKDWAFRLKGTNVAQQQANIRMTSFSFKARRLGVEIQNKLIEAFFRLEPKLTQIIAKLGEFVDSIGPEEIDKFSNALKGVLSVFDSILTKLKDIKAILTVSGIGAVIGGVIGGVTLGPAGIIPGAKLGALGGAALGTATAGGGSPDFRGTFPFNQAQQNSKSEVTVNINAPAGVVQSVQSKSDNGTNLNLGQNRGLNFGTP